MHLTGLHHLTAVTARAAENVAFYTGTLGLRLVKKTVNQDDVSAYHLFYADGLASPGTDITFFDLPGPPFFQCFFTHTFFFGYCPYFFFKENCFFW